eukprot:NODE_70_length_2253_cov_305.193813.p1 GENE.NODE_70_length_2253_cov_305.193813~~NODE_70_length_2253_cov_305.193813.p1  ORF type:complete len:680 (-),score=211.33 NODE_70_length_2253_cov_305.193813:198-2066(-)
MMCIDFYILLHISLNSLPSCYVFVGEAYRGVKWNFPSLEAHSEEALKQYFHPGRTLYWYEPKSTSRDKEVMQSEQFCGLVGAGTVFHIHVKRGFKIELLSAFGVEEKEVLMDMLSGFKVQACIPLKTISKLHAGDKASSHHKGAPDVVVLHQFFDDDAPASPTGKIESPAAPKKTMECPICMEHARPYEGFCLTCDAAMCPTCIFGHSGHHVKSLEGAFNEKRPKLREQMDQAKNFINEANVKRSADLDAQAEEVRAEIRKWKEEKQKNLPENDALQSAKEKSEDADKALGACKERIRELKEQLQAEEAKVTGLEQQHEQCLAREREASAKMEQAMEESERCTEALMMRLETAIAESTSVLSKWAQGPTIDGEPFMTFLDETAALVRKGPHLVALLKQRELAQWFDNKGAFLGSGWLREWHESASASGTMEIFKKEACEIFGKTMVNQVLVLRQSLPAWAPHASCRHLEFLEDGKVAHRPLSISSYPMALAVLDEGETYASLTFRVTNMVKDGNMLSVGVIERASAKLEFGNGFGRAKKSWGVQSRTAPRAEGGEVLAEGKSLGRCRQFARGDLVRVWFSLDGGRAGVEANGEEIAGFEIPKDLVLALGATLPSSCKLTVES